MKISEKQLLMLVDIAKASTNLAGSFGGYRQEDRIRLVNEIINRQSNQLFKVKEPDPYVSKETDVPQD